MFVHYFHHYQNAHHFLLHLNKFFPSFKVLSILISIFKHYSHIYSSCFHPNSCSTDSLYHTIPTPNYMLSYYVIELSLLSQIVSSTNAQKCTLNFLQKRDRLCIFIHKQPGDEFIT
jgi:hypothetical protein